jgi:Xaa-Pro dipeptidase
MQKMTETGVTRGLITDPTNILYFTGAAIIPYERFMGLLINAESQKNYLIIPEFEKGRSKDNLSIEILYRDNEDPLSRLVDLIGHCQCIGLEKKQVAFAIVERMLDLLKQKQAGGRCGLSDLGKIIENMRFHKDPLEIEYMEKAAGYTDSIIGKARQMITAGVSERNIKREIYLQITEEAGLIGPACPIQVSSGVHASVAHGLEGEKSLADGDPVIIDYGVMYEYYCSDITRTFFVGKPDPEWVKIYQIVLDAQQRSIELVKPGVAIKEIDRAARECIDRAGYGEYFTVRRVGHGLGLGIHELPSLHDNNDGILEEGMVFTIEPGIYIPGKGGVRIEDDLVVTRVAGVSLTKYPKRIDDVIVS